MTKPANPFWKAGEEHLAAVDPKLKLLIDRTGSCSWHPSGDYFAVLIRAVVGQLISAKAATTINARVRVLCGGEIAPDTLCVPTEAELRKCGLTGNKVLSLMAIAAHARANPKFWADPALYSDEQIEAELLPLRGVGVWTVQMFLMFALCRPDVLPTGDLVIRQGFQKHFERETEPPIREMKEFAERWKPWRTLASWYLWRSVEIG